MAFSEEPSDGPLTSRSLERGASPHGGKKPSQKEWGRGLAHQYQFLRDATKSATASKEALSRLSGMRVRRALACWT